MKSESGWRGVRVVFRDIRLSEWNGPNLAARAGLPRVTLWLLRPHDRLAVNHELKGCQSNRHGQSFDGNGLSNQPVNQKLSACRSTYD